MIKKGTYSTLVLLFLLASCLPEGSTPKPALTSQGEAVLYLQPMPQEAQNLRIIIQRISAIGTDGMEVPFDLSFKELQGKDFTGRQRLLATVILPPGSYTGISVEVDKALVQTEEGEMALFVPEEPVIAQRLFKVERGKASALFLTFSGSGAVTSGITFTPSFALETSSRQLINLVGYVSNSASNLISVFNKKTMLVVDAIATGSGPKGIALDQRRIRAYVAVSGDDTIEAYNVFTGRLIGKALLNFRDHPVDLGLTPDGKTLVSVNHDSNTVSIIDAISLLRLETIKVGERPTSVVIDPSGFKAYVMNTLSSTISVIDLTQRTLTVTLSVEGDPLQGAFNSAGDKLYVVSRNSPNLSVIDPARLTITDRIFTGTGARSIKVDVRTGLILVGKEFGREITIVDPSTSMFVDTIEVGGQAGFMTIDGQENTLFVSVPDKGIVQKLNLTSKRIMGEIDVGAEPDEVVVIGER